MKNEHQRFIRTDDGSYLNTDCIESFRDTGSPDGAGNSVTILTAGGQTHVLSTITADELAYILNRDGRGVSLSDEDRAALRVLKEKLDNLTHAVRTMPTSMRVHF